MWTDVPGCLGFVWNWKVHLGMSGCPSLHERIRPSLKVEECQVQFTHAGVLTHLREQLSGRAPCILRWAITRLSPAGVKERNGHVHVEGDAGGGGPGGGTIDARGLKSLDEGRAGSSPVLGTISIPPAPPLEAFAWAERVLVSQALQPDRGDANDWPVLG